MFNPVLTHETVMIAVLASLIIVAIGLIVVDGKEFL